MVSNILQAPADKPLALPGFESINRVWDRMDEIWTAKILPGEYYVTQHHESIITVLGSCVSACLRDTEQGIGGMNHFMLPASSNRVGDAWNNKDAGKSARYGAYAMEQLINDILKNGGKKCFLEIKVFGGGQILANMTDIGKRNIEFVLEFIRTEGLNIVSQDLGDIYPRKVVYYPQTGKVRIKKLRSLSNNTIHKREEEYSKEIETQSMEGSIDLF